MSDDILSKNGMHNKASAQVFKNAASLRERMTKAEIKLWGYLRTKPQGYKFRRQHPIGGFILDFYCHKLRLSIELDGLYHLSDSQRADDAKRTAYLNNLGITEIRFQNKVILNELDNWILQFEEQLRAGTLQGKGAS